VAPRAHKFAIVGDKAIHQKCGEELWQRLVERMREHFRNEEFSDDLVDAIREAGEALPFHFPKRSTVITRNAVKRAAFCFAVILALAANGSLAAEVIPPKPAHYFNDYAGIVSPSAAQQFDRELSQFERDTSNQVVVAIFPKMQSDDDIAAYTQRVAESWGVGQKDKRNGIVLFAFIEDRKMIIQVGYGLEGALPDVSAFNITEYQMKPQFIAGDYEAGVRIGINSILKAIRGEYRGSGKSVSEERRRHRSLWPLLAFGFLFVLGFLGGLHRTARRGYGYSSKGSGWMIDWGAVLFFWLNLFLSGSSSRGGSSSSGGFSGGGGSFGGGGAGSTW
jgi:uncharacterized protein